MSLRIDPIVALCAMSSAAVSAISALSAIASFSSAALCRSASPLSLAASFDLDSARARASLDALSSL
jgi:hypothetical protein